MRRPQNYSVLIDPTADEPIRERDNFVCSHCQKIVEVEPFADPTTMGGLCKQCMGLVCPKCYAKGVCLPWEKQMDRMERRARLHAAAHDN